MVHVTNITSYKESNNSQFEKTESLLWKLQICLSVCLSASLIFSNSYEFVPMVVREPIKINFVGSSLTECMLLGTFLA